MLLSSFAIAIIAHQKCLDKFRDGWYCRLSERGLVKQQTIDELIRLREKGKYLDFEHIEYLVPVLLLYHYLFSFYLFTRRVLR